MQIALFQGPATPGAVEANLAAVGEAAGRAAAQGADLLLTAELAITGYNIGALSAERAQPVDGAIFAALGEVARTEGLAIGYGYAERDGDRIYNSVAVVGRDGALLANYRKTHLFGELDRSLFSPGTDLIRQFRLGDLTCGLAICYDMEFPEVPRAHAEAGTDVLLAPTGLMKPFEVVSQVLVPARAYESQLYVAYVNRCDVEGDLDYCGLSCAVGPDGADLARAGAGEELLIVGFDAETLRASRKLNTHLGDRRTDLYPR